MQFELPVNREKVSSAYTKDGEHWWVDISDSTPRGRRIGPFRTEEEAKQVWLHEGESIKLGVTLLRHPCHVGC